MPRQPPPMFFEYVDKHTVLPRWIQPQWMQRRVPQSSPQPTTQQQVSFVVVNNTSRPVPMQALLQLASRYIPRQLPPPQSPNQQIPNQPAPQQTVVIVIGGQADQMGNTDDLLNRLFMVQQPQTIPASQAFIDSLQQTPITSDAIAKQAQCTVCMEEFHVGEHTTQLPCQHFFHHDCIKPWLSTQHTCPMCRHELPSDTTTQTRTQIPIYPALPAPSTIQTLRQVYAPQSVPTTPIPVIASPVSSLQLTSPSSSPLTESSATATSPTTTDDSQHSGTKRGPLSPVIGEEHASKKTKVDQPEDTEKASDERPSEAHDKKTKTEEKSETEERRTRRQGGNEFGFKKGFLLR